jgi:hypothetical protein
MATREEIKVRVGKKRVKRIAKRFGIDIETAKKFYADRMEAKAGGVRLPFYKWKKKHLSFDESMGDVEEGEFDNFFSRKKRQKMKKRLRSIRGRIKSGVLKGGIRQLIRQKKRKGKKIGGILRKLANPMYMSKPRNVRKLFGGVRAMAKDIVSRDRRIISKIKGRGRGRGSLFGGGGRRPQGRPNPYYRPQGRPNPYYRGGQAVMSDNYAQSYFEGDDYNDNTFMNATGGGIMAKVKKYKWYLVGAGAVGFLFFTPMGKKLIGQ